MLDRILYLFNMVVCLIMEYVSITDFAFTMERGDFFVIAFGVVGITNIALFVNTFNGDE